MNCVLFAKMDQVFSKENKTLKKYWEIGKKYWKSQGILSVRKSRNHDPVETSPEVQNRGISGTTKRTCVLQKILKKEY